MCGRVRRTSRRGVSEFKKVQTRRRLSRFQTQDFGSPRVTQYDAAVTRCCGAAACRRRVPRHLRSAFASLLLPRSARTASIAADTPTHERSAQKAHSAQHACGGHEHRRRRVIATRERATASRKHTRATRTPRTTRIALFFILRRLRAAQSALLFLTHAGARSRMCGRP